MAGSRDRYAYSTFGGYKIYIRFVVYFCNINKIILFYIVVLLGYLLFPKAHLQQNIQPNVR